MSLADHWSDGKYLGEGRHVVTVTGHKMVDFNSGNRGVEFALRSDDGLIGKTQAFAIVDKALWRLAQFAKSCGKTQAECKRYDPFKDTSHTMLHNCRVGVVVEKGEKYHEVVDFFQPPLAGKTQAVKPQDRTVAQAIDEANAQTVPPDDENIPF